MSELHTDEETLTKYDGIYDYLRRHCHYARGCELDALYDRLHRYPDIYYELYMYIMEGKFPEKPLKVKGYTAADIIRDYHLTVPGAYSYMVHLREGSVSSAIHNMLGRHQNGQRRFDMKTEQAEWLSKKGIDTLIKNQSDPAGNNLILSNKVAVSMDPGVTHRNNNVLVIGQGDDENAGLESIVSANVLSANSALVIMDHNNHYYTLFTDKLQERGYQVMQIDPPQIYTPPENQSEFEDDLKKIAARLQEEPFLALFVNDKRIKRLGPLFKVEYSAGEYISYIMRLIMNPRKLQKAQNHNIRFFLDYRDCDYNTMPDFSFEMQQMPKYNNIVLGGGLSVFLLANDQDDFNRHCRYVDKTEGICACCDTKIYMGVSEDEAVDIKTANRFSALCGKRELTWIQQAALHCSKQLDLISGVKCDRTLPDMVPQVQLLALGEDKCVIKLKDMMPIKDDICKATSEK